MKVWITKYALTSGTFSVEAQQSAVRPTVVSFWRALNRRTEYAHGKDWHESRSDAIDRAEDMRQAKLKSLRKSIAKLEAMDLTLCN